MPPVRRLTIGKVLRLLEPDFPDISASKIRFLEAEGLLSPERTPSGYRLYSRDDVERLRYILTAQRDRFWPLKVIAEALDALDRGLTDPGADAPGRPVPPPLASDADLPDAAGLASVARPVELTDRELCAATGLHPELLAGLQIYGLLRPNAQGLYDGSALAVAEAAQRLAQFGIEARHLRPFRTAADREIGLVEQVLATRAKGSDESAKAHEVLAACIALHAALVKAGLGAR